MGASAIRWALTRTLVVGSLVWVGASPAHGQFFGGRGFGFGYGFGNYTPASVNFLDRESLARTSAAAASKPQPLSAPEDFGVRNNPSTLPPFGERYGVESRRLYLEDRYAMGHGGDAAGARPAKAPATAPSRPRYPLTSFFDKDQHLVWPTDAPVTGDLKAKRDAAETAVTEVLKELTGGNHATVAAVTDARASLLDYGRPALRQVRAADAAGGSVGDAFDGFLTALYDTLGRAASSQVASNR